MKDVIPPTVAEALRAGNKIEAIKRLRGITGLGLKEAKDWVDAYERGAAEPVELHAAREAPRKLDLAAKIQLSKDALAALNSGNKIEAIKVIRQATGMGLAEAKALVDRTEGQMHPKSPSIASRKGLAPGQVAPGGGGMGKWMILFAAAVIAILAGLYLNL